MDEKYIIQKYFVPLAKNDVALNLNDDVSQIDITLHKNLITNQDSLVMGTHFFADDDPEYIAKKAIRVNVSDIISKGVSPYGYYLSFGINSSVNEDWVRSFTNGLAQDQKYYNLKLLGGDTIFSSNTIFISINMISFSDNKIISRSTAIIDDDIYVTGTIGESAIGLYMLKEKNNKIKISDFNRKRLISRYHLPEPNLKYSELIQKFANSSMDTTDGLVNDLKNLSVKSGKDFCIDLDKIPYSDSAKEFLKQFNDYDIVNFGGDDYECIFSANKDNRNLISDFAHQQNIQVTKIGRVLQGSKEPVIMDQNNKLIGSSNFTFKHF
jgi:thiamine-monophosphate kinase